MHAEAGGIVGIGVADGRVVVVEVEVGVAVGIGVAVGRSLSHIHQLLLPEHADALKLVQAVRSAG
jgi:hypothetical protein